MTYLVENRIHIPSSTATDVLKAPPSAWHLTLCGHMVQFSHQVGRAAEWAWCNACLLKMHEQIHRGTRTTLPHEFLSTTSSWKREKGILLRKGTKSTKSVVTEPVAMGFRPIKPTRLKKIKVIVQQFEPPLIIKEGNVSVKQH